jgi:hypothetical protein
MDLKPKEHEAHDYAERIRERLPLSGASGGGGLHEVWSGA